MVPSLLHRPLSVYRYAPKKIPSRFLTVIASIGWYAVDPAIPDPVVSDGGIQTSVMAYGVFSTSSRRSSTYSVRGGSMVWYVWAHCCHDLLSCE